MVFRGTQEEQSLTALAQRAQQGCRVSFSRLVDRLGGRLLRFFQARIRSQADAEDLVQDTFLKAYQHLDRYDINRPFSTWLFAIAYRQAVDFHRRRTRRKETSADELLTVQNDGPLEDLINQEQQITLWQTVKSLPAKQHDALWLFYNESMAVADIADVMQTSKLHVRVLLHRGRNGLAQRLESMDKIHASSNSQNDNSSPWRPQSSMTACEDNLSRFEVKV